MLRRTKAYLKPGLAALAAACILAAMAPASAQPRRDDRGYHGGGRYHDHGYWHHPYGYAGGYYAPPPVVYAPPYYAPPPVVYGPGIGLNIHIR